MQALTFGCYVSFLTSSLLAYAYATVGGQYSVNVHFVPPLVTASCQVAQFWTPPNVTCALCFCMTGTLSRCIPQPGCNPQAQNSSTSTVRPDESTTEGGGSTTSTPSPAKPPDAEAGAKPPAASPPEMDSTTTEAPPPSSSESSSSSSKIRAAKPGKSRRRRHINQIKSVVYEV